MCHPADSLLIKTCISTSFAASLIFQNFGEALTKSERAKLVASMGDGTCIRQLNGGIIEKLIGAIGSRLKDNL